MSMIKFQNVYFRYQDTDNWVIRHLNLSIKENEKVAIIGKNGSGKSTLAKLICGLLPCEKGRIFIDDEELTTENILELRKKIGMVFQNPENQFVGMTVKEDVAFGLENQGIKREEMLLRISNILAKVGMENFANLEPQHLSGGQKQRVAIASAMVLEPSILILDEATSMLDPVGRKEMISLVQTLHEQQPFTLVMITHDMNEAILADRIVVLDQGEIVLDGVPRELFSNHSDTLKKLGFPAPFTIEVAMALKERGILFDSLPMNQKELISGLWKLHSKT